MRSNVTAANWFGGQGRGLSTAATFVDGTAASSATKSSLEQILVNRCMDLVIIPNETILFELKNCRKT